MFSESDYIILINSRKKRPLFRNPIVGIATILVVRIIE